MILVTAGVENRRAILPIGVTPTDLAITPAELMFGYHVQQQYTKDYIYMQRRGEVQWPVIMFLRKHEEATREMLGRYMMYE